VQLLVDNRSDSTKMHGATIRFIDRHVGRGDILLGKCLKPIRCITGRYDVVDTYSTARCSNPGGGELVSFSAPVQNGPQAHPVYRPMGTGSSGRTVAGGWRGYRVFRAYSGRRMTWVPGLPGVQWPEDGVGTGSSARTVAGGWRGYRVFRANSGRRMATTIHTHLARRL
jgi:hypothetical protein